jgi:thiamine pyrophosphate-dependent acetolactate synthase large subunit-like protein
VLALDWVDLAGTLSQAWPDLAVPCPVVNVTLDAQLARGWSKDHFALPPVDVYLACDPDVAVHALAAALGDDARQAGGRTVQSRAYAPAFEVSGAGASVPETKAPADCMPLRSLAAVVEEVTRGVELCITRVPLGWNGAYREFRHPLDYIGLEGGGGIGAGPGITIGAALALKGSGRIAFAMLGDGDFLMGVTALWTAVHYALPCLMIVANNRSFYNDERHQERVAVVRGRPVENKGIGQRIEGPDIDIAAMARAQGAHGIGPVTSPEALRVALHEGLRGVAAGEVVVIDARVVPGYDANTGGGAQTARGSTK